MNKINLFFLFCLSISASFTLQAEERAAEQYIEVVESEKIYEQHEEYSTVSILGRLQNNSSAYIDRVVLEGQFFDSNGKLIDTVTERMYEMVVPPNDGTAFVLSKEAIKSVDDYSSYKIRATFARLKTPCSKKNTDNLFYNILINWAPLFIIIGVWVVFLIRFQKKSPQAKTLELVEKQNELIKINGDQFKEFLEIVREYTKRNT
jgi:ATP-dependent Zn protease